MNFSRKSVLAKAKSLKSPATHRIHKLKVLAARLILIFLVVCAFTGISGLAGIINGLMETAPGIESINVVPEGYATTILNAKGKVVQTLVGERRTGNMPLWIRSRSICRMLSWRLRTSASGPTTALT